MMAIASVSMLSVAQQPLRSGIDQTDFDTSVRPADDFYEYACGGWMKKNPLPAAYSRYGSFDKLGEDNSKRINGILAELLAKSYPQGTVEQKLSDLYKSAMDSTRRDKEGVSPLKPLIDRLEKAKNVEELFAIELEQGPYGSTQMLGAGFGADEKNASQNILNVSQTGIALRQKEYYLDNDAATKKIREAYKKHVVQMFQLLGFKKGVAERKMKNVMKVETALAKVSRLRTELRDPMKTTTK